MMPLWLDGIIAVAILLTFMAIIVYIMRRDNDNRRR